jgi:DNA polymerase-3 subunit gamma/tau
VSTSVDSTAVRQIWPELLSQVGQRSKPTLALLLNATVHAVEGDVLVLSMPTVGLARQLNQESRAEHIRAALKNLFSGEWQVRCVHGDGGTPAPPAETPRRTPPPAPPQEQRPPRQAPPPQAQAPQTQIPQTQAPQVQASQRRQAPPSDIPLPPEPPPDDEPPPPEDAVPPPPAPKPVPAPPAGVQVEDEPEHDEEEDLGGPAPDVVGIGLLTAHLGARPLEQT